jgi:hypothetical protein
MIDRTTATKILHPLCGMNGYRKGLETIPRLLTIATGALNEAHLQAAVNGWMNEPINKFPAPGQFLAILNSLLDLYKPDQHGCQICQNSARMVTHLYLVTFLGTTYMKDPRQRPEIVQRNWRSEWGDPKTGEGELESVTTLRAKLGANLRLVAGARKCECAGGTR